MAKSKQTATERAAWIGLKGAIASALLLGTLTVLAAFVSNGRFWQFVQKDGDKSNGGDYVALRPVISDLQIDVLELREAVAEKFVAVRTDGTEDLRSVGQVSVSGCYLDVRNHSAFPVHLNRLELDVGDVQRWWFTEKGKPTSESKSECQECYCVDFGGIAKGEVLPVDIDVLVAGNSVARIPLRFTSSAMQENQVLGVFAGVRVVSVDGSECIAGYVAVRLHPENATASRK